MAIFEGSVQEFHHYVGPRIRNAINTFCQQARKARNGVCEHCKKTVKTLNSAHIHGRGRRSIIENILSAHESNGIVRCDIKAVEREILDGHGTVADTFKFLCKDCHVQYDKYEERASDMESNQGLFGMRWIARVVQSLAPILRAVVPRPYAEPSSPVPHTQSPPIPNRPTSEPTLPDFEESKSHEEKRDRMVEALERREGCAFIRKKRSLYWNQARNIRAVLSVSKRHPNDRNPYWYGYQPEWERFLDESEIGYFVLGCIGLKTAFAIPKSIFYPMLRSLNKTTKPNGTYYWHVHLIENPSGIFRLRLRGRGQSIPLSGYLLPLELQ